MHENTFLSDVDELSSASINKYKTKKVKRNNLIYMVSHLA